MPLQQKQQEIAPVKTSDFKQKRLDWDCPTTFARLVQNSLANLKIISCYKELIDSLTM